MYILCSHEWPDVPSDFLYKHKFKDKMVKNFKMVDTRALNQPWDPSEPGVTCTCTGQTPVKTVSACRASEEGRLLRCHGSGGF